jgi:ureidoglycolate dehydrogenase (NAD+)
LPQINFQNKLVDHHALYAFCIQVLLAVDFDKNDAETVANSLTHANLSGWDSHGVARLPHYLLRIEQGSIKPRAQMNLKSLAPAAARLDGGHGMGHVVMASAAGHAIEKAKAAGACWVSVCNSSHCGTLSYSIRKIAEAGMIGIGFTHVDPMVVPFGASEPFCGTNPICITAPGRDGRVLCLDMATSVTPWNSIENAATEGVPIPAGWAMDEHGNETLDPKQVRAIYPMAGYKGSGLGLMIDVLCSMLSDSPYGPDIPKMYGDLSKHRQLGGLVGAIQIASFIELSRFQQRIDEMLHRWSALRPATPDGRVLYPGEPEEINRQQRMANGIPLGLQLIEAFDEIALRLGIEKLHLQTSHASPTETTLHTIVS